MTQTDAKIGELALRYIQKTERAFEGLKLVQGVVPPDAESVRQVIDEAKRYLEDAKYYLRRKRSATSLASVAYCEGLLDALRMLRVVEFAW